MKKTHSLTLLATLLLTLLTGLQAAEMPAPSYFDLKGSALTKEEATTTWRERPNMTVYLPDPTNNTGTALIVFPGGGYGQHAITNHVELNARYFLPKGIAVIGVRYRLHHPHEGISTTVSNALMDARQAMRLVRSRSVEWHLDPKRIGVLGYSAGSHLALKLACGIDLGDAHAVDPVRRQSCRPDFMVALCPWNLGGIDKVIDFPFSRQAPPSFIATAKDDTIAPAEFAIGIAEALRELSVPVELQVYPKGKGGHGAFELNRITADAKWHEEFLLWLAKIQKQKERP